MPIFDYHCVDCEQTFEVFHKVKERSEDIVCPNCSSRNFKKLMSAPAVSMGASSSGSGCESGACGCSSGACGLN